LRRQIRTAWVVASPRLHSLATSVVRSGDESSAAVFTSRDQADIWFQSARP